jgi:hypothetical protein
MSAGKIEDFHGGLSKRTGLMTTAYFFLHAGTFASALHILVGAGSSYALRAFADKSVLAFQENPSSGNG